MPGIGERDGFLGRFPDEIERSIFGAQFLDLNEHRYQIMFAHGSGSQQFYFEAIQAIADVVA